MAMEGRAVALLKDVHSRLHMDVGDIDMLSLKNDTPEIITNPTVLYRWTRVLRAVAVPLVAMGREVREVESFISRQRDSANTMLVIMYLLLVCIILLVTTAVKFMSQDTPALAMATTLSAITATIVVIFALAKCWSIALYERVRKYDFNLNGPIMSKLRMYRYTLSDRFLVKYVAAQASGVRLSDLLKEAKQQEDKIYRGDDECAPKDATAASACNYDLLKCVDPADMPTIEEALKQQGCIAQLADIADRLMELKGDVTKYDRPFLWRCVAQNIDRLRHLISVSHDYGGNMSADVDRDSVRRLLVSEVIPLMAITAAEVHAFRQPAVTDALMGLGPAANTRTTNAASKAECWASCTSDGTCMMARYDVASKQCVRVDSYGALKNWTYAGKDAPPTKDGLLLRDPVTLAQGGSGGNAASVMVCGLANQRAVGRANAIDSAKIPNIDRQAGATGMHRWCLNESMCDAVGDGAAAWTLDPLDSFKTFLSPPASQAAGPNACVKVPAADLYTAVATGPALASTLTEHASAIANDLWAFEMRHRLRVRLAPNRKFIDIELARYYGHDVYTRFIRPVVDNIMQRVVWLSETDPNRTPKPLYIDTVRFAQKAKAMSTAEWAELEHWAERAQTCVKQHGDMFPYFRNVTVRNIVKRVTNYGFVILTIVFAMFMMTHFLKVKDGVLPMESYIQRTVAVISVLSILAVVMEWMSSKTAIRIDHNHDVIDNNGQALTAGVSALKIDLVLLRQKATAVPYDAMAAQRAAASSLNSIQTAVQAYDRCNTVTAERQPFPFPTIELVLYSLIGLAFVGLAVAVAQQIAPADAADNLRALFGMRSSIMRGDFNPGLNMAAVERIVGCNEPPDFVWSMFLWFGIITLFLLTWWFLFSTRDAANNYESAVRADPDCDGM